jgi:large subunit ribosomal protein L10
VHRTEKERVVEELTERLRETESLLVADYRGLTNAQLADVRSRLREHGTTFTVVKNSLTRRAAEAADAEQLLALLDGPTAIAFVSAGGDAVAAAKALADTAKDTKILSLRGGVLEGKQLEAADVDVLANLPPIDVLKGQVVGVIIAPVTQIVALLDAPLRDLVGVIDARITQLEEAGGSAQEPVAEPTDAPQSREPQTDEQAAEPPEQQHVTDAATDGSGEETTENEEE